MLLLSGRTLSLFGLMAASILVMILAWQNRGLEKDLTRWRDRATLPYPGFVVPSFETTTLSGDSVTVGRAKGPGRQVLFVFNTRCAFCVATLPAWRELFTVLDSVQEPEVDVYGISLDPEPETRGYVRDHGLTFPVLVLPNQRLVKLYRAENIPQTVVLDYEGTVVYARLGTLNDRAFIDSVISGVRQAALLTSIAGE